MPGNKIVKIKITNIDGQVNNFQIVFCFFEVHGLNETHLTGSEINRIKNNSDGQGST